MGVAAITQPIKSDEILKLLDQVISQYSPGGTFGKAELKLLGREKTKALAKGEQSLVSSGLAGTTAGVGMGQKWEEEVGMPSKLKLEDTRTQRLMEAFLAKAGYLERAGSEQTAYDLAQRQTRPSGGGGRNVGSVSGGTRSTFPGGTGGGGFTPGGAGDTGGYGSDFGGAGGGYGGGEGFGPGRVHVMEGGAEITPGQPAGLPPDLAKKIADIRAGRTYIAGVSKDAAIEHLLRAAAINQSGGGAASGM